MMSALRLPAAHAHAKADRVMCNEKPLASVVIDGAPACRRHGRLFGALEGW